MKGYKITASMELKPFIAEVREVTQALQDFTDRLTEIDEKYSDAEINGKERKWVE